jgi:hypothetical protein
MGCRSFGLALSLADEQVLVDVGNDTSAGNGGLDQQVQFLVSSDRQLQVPGSDPAHLEVLRSISRQLQHLSRQVLQNGSRVDRRSRTHPVARRHPALEEAVDPAHGELQSRPRGLGLGGSLGLAHLAALAAFASLSSLASHNYYKALLSSPDLNSKYLNAYFDWLPNHPPDLNQECSGFLALIGADFCLLIAANLDW